MGRLERFSGTAITLQPGWWREKARGWYQAQLLAPRATSDLKKTLQHSTKILTMARNRPLSRGWGCGRTGQWGHSAAVPKFWSKLSPDSKRMVSLSSCLQAELPTAAALTLQAYFWATHSPAQPGAAALSCPGPGKVSGLNSVWKGLSKFHIRLQNLSISEPCRSQKPLSKKPKVRPHSAFRTLPSQQPGLDGASGSAAF